MDTELKGHRYKNADGRETYEILDAQPEFLKNLAASLKSQFGFRQQSKTSVSVLVGLDEVFLNFTNGNITLLLGWDSWSGCYLSALQPEGDECVTAIGDYIDMLLETH